MARRGLATALQAALAGFGGYGQGVIAQRERQQKLSQAEEERKRREMLDILDVQERGYMRPEQLVQARQEAAAPTSRVAQSAILSALSPTRPAPLPSTADIATVMETAALRQPLAGQQRITVGGQEYVRPEAPMVTERRERGMALAQRAFESAEDRRTRAAEQQANREAELARTRISAGAAANVERMRQAEEARRDEAAGMAFLSANRSNPAVVNALGAIIGSNREFARRPGLAAAQLLKQSMSESEMDIKRATAGLPTREEMAGAGGAAGSAQAGGSVARRLQGGSYGATVGGQANAAKPTKEQRALDLISQGKSQAEIKRIMLAEGYTFND